MRRRPAPGAPSYYEPGISPDGSEIAFVSGGDIWTVPRAAARRGCSSRTRRTSRGRCTRRTAGCSRSTRTATAARTSTCIDLASGDVRRLTHDSGSEELTGWSGDSQWVYFTSTGEDVGGMSDVFRVRASGGTPMAVAADRYETEFFAAPSRDEPGLLAIATRGRMAQSQWWRNGHSHIDQSEIWTVREATTSGGVPTYAKVSVGGKNLWPMWGAGGTTIHFMSDRSGAENLWSAVRDGGQEVQLTTFEDGRLLWPSISADGRTVAFERDFGIWTLDVASRAVRRLDIRLMGAVEGRPRK
jgi:tricorn protease